MTDKDRAIQKANELRIELETRYNCAFSCICNSGASGLYDMTKYGKPCVHISGSIFNENYYVTIWESETSKHYLYSSGYSTITKQEMMTRLDEHLGHNEQLRLF